MGLFVFAEKVSEVVSVPSLVAIAMLIGESVKNKVFITVVASAAAPCTKECC